MVLVEVESEAVIRLVQTGHNHQLEMADILHHSLIHLHMVQQLTHTLMKVDKLQHFSLCTCRDSHQCDSELANSCFKFEFVNRFEYGWWRKAYTSTNKTDWRWKFEYTLRFVV